MELSLPGNYRRGQVAAKNLGGRITLSARSLDLAISEAKRFAARVGEGVDRVVKVAERRKRDGGRPQEVLRVYDALAAEELCVRETLKHIEQALRESVLPQLDAVADMLDGSRDYSAVTVSDRRVQSDALEWARKFAISSSASSDAGLKQRGESVARRYRAIHQKVQARLDQLQGPMALMAAELDVAKAGLDLAFHELRSGYGLTGATRGHAESDFHRATKRAARLKAEASS